MREKIVEAITNFVLSSKDNRHKDSEKMYFDEPLVGFAQAEDHIFREYKTIIGDFHLTPKEIFEAKYGKGSFKGGTVISWILPITENTRLSNRKQKDLPSREWGHTRYFGEAFNNKLREHIVSFLEEEGYRSVAPLLMEEFKTLKDPKVGLASTWSERHTAFAAGLGTFSLNDGLITRKGIAHRCGSVVVELSLNPDERPYAEPYEYCLHYNSGKCSVCIKRCPVGAISEKGHDKNKCSDYSYNEILPQVREMYGVKIAGCGLCQTKVPCENGIPKRGLS